MKTLCPDCSSPQHMVEFRDPGGPHIRCSCGYSGPADYSGEISLEDFAKPSVSDVLRRRWTRRQRRELVRRLSRGL